jgi:hypothetical protein
MNICFVSITDTELLYRVSVKKETAKRPYGKIFIARSGITAGLGRRNTGKAKAPILGAFVFHKGM